MRFTTRERNGEDLGVGAELQQTSRVRERVRESQRRLRLLYERAEERFGGAEQRLDGSRRHHPGGSGTEDDPERGAGPA